MVNRSLFFFFSLVWLVFPACSSSLAEAEMDMSTECWSVVDTLSMKYENSDTMQVLTMDFPFVFSEDYPFNNIYFNLRVSTPGGQTNDLPLTYSLMDGEGNWYGEVSGEEASIRFDLGNMLVLNQLGSYTFQVYHYMRQENLCGVHTAGISLKAVENPDS